jgi:hypothetical protein
MLTTEDGRLLLTEDGLILYAEGEVEAFALDGSPSKPQPRLAGNVDVPKMYIDRQD